MLCIAPQSEEKIHSKELDKQLKHSFRVFREALKVLLLGTGESGKTTIIKQMKILHINGFTEEERLEKIKEIRQNIHESIYTLIDQMDKLNIDYDNEENQIKAEHIKSYGEEFIPDKNINLDYYRQVSVIWKDSGIQNCYHRSNEYQLIDSAKYFLNKIEEVSNPEYNPSHEDILHSRKMTRGIHEINFKFKDYNFKMFDVGGQRDERIKWFQVFDGIEAILFIISLADYDKKLREDENENRLIESIKLFSTVWHNRFLIDAGLIIFLNKQDLLDEKIRMGSRIGDYFPEYHDFRLKNCFDEVERTKQFVKYKIECITEEEPKYFDSHNRDNNKKRNCYYHFTTATNTENIKKVFDSVHHIIIDLNMQKAGLTL